jgi:hypothetical protein
MKKNKRVMLKRAGSKAVRSTAAGEASTVIMQLSKQRSRRKAIRKATSKGLVAMLLQVTGAAG